MERNGKKREKMALFRAALSRIKHLNDQQLVGSTLSLDCVCIFSSSSEDIAGPGDGRGSKPPSPPYASLHSALRRLNCR